MICKIIYFLQLYNLQYLSGIDLENPQIEIR